MIFTLLSPARAATKDREGKPETIVEFETDGIRERLDKEHLHLGREEGDICQACARAICGQPELLVTHPIVYQAIWTDSAELHSHHPARCSS